MPPPSAGAAAPDGRRAGRKSSDRLPRFALYGCVALAVAVVLAPLARAGYVLRYDMVFVPHQPLRADLLAPSGTLPRAVPLDALTGLATAVVPGWLVQRLVLVAILAAAALGAARLVPARHPGTRLVAALAYLWTPFLAERLLLGQWGLLLAYAALPWLVRAARDVRLGRPGAGARLLLAAACAGVTPTGGLIALVATIALTWPGPPRPGGAQPGPGTTPAGAPGTRLPFPNTRGWVRGAVRGGALPVGVLALNAPWLVAAAVTAAPARSDPAGVAAFAARAENWAGTLAALAGTGGIWNAQAVPASRTAWIVPVFTLGLLVAAAYGLGPLRRRWPEGTARRLALLAGAALLLAAAGALPGTSGALRAAVAHVPGAGLLRDGQKFLIPYALCLALCVALAAERLATRVSATAGRLVLIAFALLPVMLLPDLAWGVGGKLRPVAYPADWDTVSRAVATDPGPVLSLPMSAYRSYGWNPETVVLDPAIRYLPAPVVADDRLRVGPTVIAGESPEAATIRERLAAGGPAADPGLRWVLVQRDTGIAVPPTALAGLILVHRGPALELYGNPGFRPADPPPPAPTAMLAAYLLAAAVLAAAAWRRGAAAAWRRGHRPAAIGRPHDAAPDRAPQPPTPAAPAGRDPRVVTDRAPQPPTPGASAPEHARTRAPLIPAPVSAEQTRSFDEDETERAQP